MKILVTSLPDLTKLNPQRPHQLLNHLSRKHDIYLLCANAWWLENNEDEYLKKLFRKLNYSYFTNRKVNSVFQEIYGILDNCVNSEIITDDYDMHINFNSLIFGYFVTLKMSKYGIPSIFDICDDIPETIRSTTQLPHFTRNTGSWVGKKLMEKIIKMSSKVTYPSTALSNSYKFPSDKSVRISNGIDMNLFKPNANINMQLNESFIIGFVGVLNEWVDLEPAFIALKELKSEINVKMIVVGGGKKLSYFKNMANNYEILDNVIFTGHIFYDQVGNYISYMDVCLICRKTSEDSQNSQPLKLFEYMALGKPVISVPLRGVKENAKDNILYASNSYEFKKNILMLYKNKKLRDEFGEKGREFVKKGYSWDFISDEFEKTLIETIGEN